MKRQIFMPAWLSVLSLAIALFVPLGGALIADTTMDARDKAGNIVHDGGERLIPPEASAEQGNRQRPPLQSVLG
jgi:hypothetical protein